MTLIDSRRVKEEEEDANKENYFMDSLIYPHTQQTFFEYIRHARHSAG